MKTMFNNSNTCGSNEAPSNVVASVKATQNNASSINHNLNDIGKYIQETGASANEYYDPYNFHNFSRPAVNMPSVIHPFQLYQNMGHGSPFSSQNTQLSHESALQNYIPGVRTSTQPESFNGALNFSENYHTKTLSDLLSSTFREPAMTKGYPLNIPQVPSNFLRKSSDVAREDLKLETNKHSTLSKQSPDPDKTQIREISDQTSPKYENSSSVGLFKKTSKEHPTSQATSDKVQSEEMEEVKEEENSIQYVDKKITEPLNQTTTPVSINISSPKAKKSTYKIINNNTAEDNTLKPIIFKKTLSESKRKSLEKTVKIIESILISTPSNNTKYDARDRSKKSNIEENTDPLALSPNPETKVSEESNSGSDSDNEVLMKKVTSKTKAKPKSSLKQQNITNTNTKPPDGVVKVKVEDIKLEHLSRSGLDENPFARDCNGTNREEVGDVTIIGIENSVEEAMVSVNIGPSIGYFECPECWLLFQHPKRFLVHTKWHSFGLLNERRAAIAREKEEQAKMKRDARKEERIQRLTAVLPETQAAKLRCKDCDIVLPTKSSYKMHRARVHPKRSQSCQVCHIPLPDAESLRAHLASHEDREAGGHQCPHCHKRFKHRHSLAKHADTHREKTHSCPTCGKLFGSEALVKRHLITHERHARGPDQCCTYCGKAFYEAYHLRVHERTHKNDRPFKCETCNSGFVSNSGLTRHIKVSHQNVSKPFSCPVCKKCFSSAAIRARHELRAHADQALLPHQCDICDARFVKIKDLKTHVYRLHPSGPMKKKSKKDAKNADIVEQTQC